MLYHDIELPIAFLDRAAGLDIQAKACDGSAAYWALPYALTCACSSSDTTEITPWCNEEKG